MAPLERESNPRFFFVTIPHPDVAACAPLVLGFNRRTSIIIEFPHAGDQIAIHRCESPRFVRVEASAFKFVVFSEFDAGLLHFAADLPIGTEAGSSIIVTHRLTGEQAIINRRRGRKPGVCIRGAGRLVIYRRKEAIL